MGKYVLASIRAHQFTGGFVRRGTKYRGYDPKGICQIYPREGWVEHDSLEIYSSQYVVMMEFITQYDVSPWDIAAIGITNQRETTVVWDSYGARPVYNAVVWQCRWTADLVQRGFRPD